jgi:hypothetical protein
MHKERVCMSGTEPVASGKCSAVELNTSRHFSSFSFFLFFFLFFFKLVFRDRVSLCCLGCSGTHFVDQASLELRDLPASASRVLGLKACTTMPGSFSFKTGLTKFPRQDLNSQFSCLSLPKPQGLQAWLRMWPYVTSFFH